MSDPASEVSPHAMEDAQIRWAMSCVMQWITLYHIHLKRPPTDADAVHSALLYRLFSGKKPLPKPPPLRHSYPDYALAEGEKVQVGAITELTRPHQVEVYGEGAVCIDGGVGWKWVEKEGDAGEGRPEKGVLEYKDGSRYRVWRETFELNTGNPDVKMTQRSYVLQRIMEDSDGQG